MDQLKFSIWIMTMIFADDENFTCCQSVLPVASCRTTSATSVTSILEQVGQISLQDSQGWWILFHRVVNLIWVVESLSLRVTEWGAFKESKSTVMPYGTATWTTHRYGLITRLTNRSRIMWSRLKRNQLIATSSVLAYLFPMEPELSSTRWEISAWILKLRFFRNQWWFHHLCQRLAELRYNWSKIWVVGQRKERAPG